MSNIQISSSPVEAVIYQPKNISPKGGIVLLQGKKIAESPTVSTSNFFFRF